MSVVMLVAVDIVAYTLFMRIDFMYVSMCISTSSD